MRVQCKTSSNQSGDNDGEVTPVPMPNTEVKLSSADGTWTAGSWESKSPPGQKRSSRNIASFVFLHLVSDILLIYIAFDLLQQSARLCCIRQIKEKTPTEFNSRRQVNKKTVSNDCLSFFIFLKR